MYGIFRVFHPCYEYNGARVRQYAEFEEGGHTISLRFCCSTSSEREVRAMNLVICILSSEQGIVRDNSLTRVECACRMITGILLTSSAAWPVSFSFDALLLNKLTDG